MSENFVWTARGGKFNQDVSSITLVNNTLLNDDVTVPAGRRWLILGIRAVNDDDVDRVITIWKYLEAAATNPICVLMQGTATAGGGSVVFPNSQDSASYPSHLPHLCKEGNMIRVQWAAGGASAGSVDANGLIMEYLELNVS